jgi:4,5-DOPA dioxygenase extradiol
MSRRGDEPSRSGATDPKPRPFPPLFVSHGAPTLPFDPGPTAGFLRDLGLRLGRPRAIVCISAHWETAAPRVTLAARPETIHDFYGFPDRLYDLRYPAPGEPGLASRIVDLVRGAGLVADGDPERGLDHGAWVPLMLMYPAADVPVVQLSVQPALDARHHLAIGRALAPLGGEGVMILGSGGATHNLREFGLHPIDAPPAAYARAFDDWLCGAIEDGRVDDLAEWEGRAPEARRNHPTVEHFLPLFAPLGAATAAPPVAGAATAVAAAAPASPNGRRLQSAFTWGVLSMAAFGWGT